MADRGTGARVRIERAALRAHRNLRMESPFQNPMPSAFSSWSGCRRKATLRSWPFLLSRVLMNRFNHTQEGVVYFSVLPLVNAEMGDFSKTLVFRSASLTVRPERWTVAHF